MQPSPASLIWSYRRTGKFAFHVLTGAIEAAPDLAGFEVGFASTGAELAAAVGAALARGERVLVGWSFYSPDFRAMAGELAALRRAVPDPRVVHIAGGVHASAEPLATLRAGFDLVAIGEGELLVQELARTWRDGGEVRALRGIAWLEGAELRSNGRAPKVQLDDFPPFGPRHGRYGPIEITRGCIYACRFCQTPHFAGASFRHRSVDNVAQWAAWLVERGFKDFRFLTPTCLSYGAQGTEPDLGAVERLLAAVRAAVGPGRRIHFGTFPSELRPEHVTAESLALLRRFVDNRTLIIGGQSGSDAVLEHSRRGHSVDAVERAAALALEHGFLPHVDFLMGLPGEGAADAEATLQFMERLAERGARVHAHTFMPLPGTPFKRAAPGALTAAARARVNRLASRGVLYGQWRQQEEIAADLAAQQWPEPQ